MRTDGKRRRGIFSLFYLFLNFFNMRLGEFFGHDVLLEVVCNDHTVAIPNHFPHKGIHKQLAYFNVVRIFKNFGEQIFLHVLSRQMRIDLLHRFVDLDIASVDFFLQRRQPVLCKVRDNTLLDSFD